MNSRTEPTWPHEEPPISRKAILKQFRRAVTAIANSKLTCLDVSIELQRNKDDRQGDNDLIFDITIFTLNEQERDVCSIRFYYFQRASRISVRLNQALTLIKANDFNKLKALSEEA